MADKKISALSAGSALAGTEKIPMAQGGDTVYTTPVALGATLQRLYQSSGAADSTSSNIPTDDTIPQISEGKEIFSQAITPKNAASIILIEWQLNLSHSNASGASTSCALFKDSGADAIAAVIEINDNGSSGGYVTRGSFEQVAGSTSARTYSLRYGSNASTAYVNGYGGRVFGGVNLSWFRVSEIAA